jgi:diaminopimelate decarboxylase
MSCFTRRDGTLCCEDVSLAELAQQYGTPLYVYSETAFVDVYRAYDDALKGLPHHICFAMKSNSCHAVLKSLAALGCGADIVSGGELFRAKKAGIRADGIIYSGVGKTEREMEEALQAGILMFNVESFSELATLNDVAKRLGTKAKISFRINPNVDPKTHPYIATGLKNSKFGIPWDHVMEGYRRAATMAHIEVVGVDCHIGSQLTQLAPFVEAAGKLKDLVIALRAEGFAIRYVDVGGGLGITYSVEKPPAVAEYGTALCNIFAGLDVTLIAEPGRSMSGNAGVLLTHVLYTKKTDAKRFVIVDAAMNDLARPSLYGSFHGIELVSGEPGEEELIDVVGPICESGDFLAKDRVYPRLRAGDLIAMMSAGAYGSTMSSMYNSRPLVAEVLVSGGRSALVRSRGTREDLMRGESAAPWQ